MQRLVIPVEENIAQVWQRVAPEQKAQIIHLFCLLIEKGDWQATSPASFSKLLDELSDRATTNGLTPEILESILHEP
jgi:hypothetical protein